MSVRISASTPGISTCAATKARPTIGNNRVLPQNHWDFDRPAITFCRAVRQLNSVAVNRTRVMAANMTSVAESSRNTDAQMSGSRKPSLRSKKEYALSMNVTSA
ncbi:hypothetical protein [Candidatus Palauibacter sp.]|uniref:hypothetical protein n=1 Tax=Candidatus Palauibacter sp. TaxID=3101350 RepID=UPI003B02B158